MIAHNPDVYGPWGKPLYPGSPPMNGPNGILVSHPVCKLVYDFDAFETYPDGADYIWAVPFDLAKIELPGDVLADLVWTLDHGGAVAVHGKTAVHVAHGVEVLLLMAGGSRA